MGIDNTTAATTNSYDLTSVFKGYTGVDVIAQGAGASSTALLNVIAGTSLTIDSSLLGTGNVAAVEGPTAASLLYQVAGAAGLTADSVSVGFSHDTLTVTTAMFEDANADGIATLNVTTAISAADAAAVAASVTPATTVAGFHETIGTLIDNGLSNLTISGGVGLTIGTLNEATTQASAITLTNNSGGALFVNNLTDANLGTLTLAGTGSDNVGTLALTGHILNIAGTGTASESITTLSDAALTTLSLSGTHTVSIGTFTSATGAALTISDTGTGQLVVSSFADANLTSLTLTGSVAIGPDAGPATTATLPTQAAATGATSGVTISASTDNAHINLNLTGDISGKTDSITVGNGNDYITDHGAGTINVTVGTGSNLIDVNSNANDAAYAANITLGTHTAADSIYVNIVNGAANTVNTVITGALTGDTVTFNDASILALATVSAASQASITAAANIGAAIGVADALITGADHAVAFTYNGNTYVIDSATGVHSGTVAVTDSVVELIGIHTFSASTTINGQIAVAS